MTNTDFDRWIPYATAFARSMAREFHECEISAYWREADEDVSEIPAKAYDGFFPYTSGGATTQTMALGEMALSTGCGPTLIRNRAEENHNAMRESFKQEHGREWQSCDSDYSQDDECLQYEEAWFEGGDLCFYKARAIFFSASDSQGDLDVPHVHFDVYICLDEYGRDSIPWLSALGGNSNQTAGSWSKNIPLNELSPKVWADTINEAKAAWAKFYS